MSSFKLVEEICEGLKNISKKLGKSESAKLKKIGERVGEVSDEVKKKFDITEEQKAEKSEAEKSNEGNKD